MFIVKKFAPKFKFGKHTLEWATIPDGIIDDIWENVVSIYDDYLRDNAAAAYEQLISNPVIILDNPDDIKHVQFDGSGVYVTYKTPKNFRLPSDKEFNDICDQANRVFSKKFNDKIEEYLMSKYGTLPTYHQVVKIPSNPHHSQDLLKSHDADNQIMLFMYHRECEKISPEILKEVKTTTHDIGILLSKALNNKNLKTYEKVVRGLQKINRGNHMRLEKWNNPTTLQLVQPIPNKKPKMFRLCVYRNGELLHERRGTIINYAWIDMMVKLINHIKNNDGIESLVCIIGIIDLVKPSE